PVVRPLLAAWRSEIEAHGLTRGLSPMHDPSNLDLRHFRNRLRHELLPILEGYNPGVRQSLFRTAQIMAAERELLEGLVDAAWPAAVRQAGPGCLALGRQALLAFDGRPRRAPPDSRWGCGFDRPGPGSRAAPAGRRHPLPLVPAAAES